MSPDWTSIAQKALSTDARKRIAAKPVTKPARRRNNCATHSVNASGTPLADDQSNLENHVTAIVGEPSETATIDHPKPVRLDVAVSDNLSGLIETYRRREDLIRARARLDNQGRAYCRRLTNDRDEGAKLWDRVLKEEDHPERIILEPFIDARKPLIDAQARLEKELSKLAKGEPLYRFAKGIRGLGDGSIVAIMGEAGYPIESFKSVSALWKRFGLAVIDGGRQRLVAGEAAKVHGYNPQRRSAIWNVGVSLIKQQIRKDDDGESKAIGELGQLYLDHKAYQLGRDIPKAKAHARAQRYIEKRLLRELYSESKRLQNETDDDRLSLA